MLSLVFHLLWCILLFATIYQLSHELPGILQSLSISLQMCWDYIRMLLCLSLYGFRGLGSLYVVIFTDYVVVVFIERSNLNSFHEIHIFQSHNSYMVLNSRQMRLLSQLSCELIHPGLSIIFLIMMADILRRSTVHIQESCWSILWHSDIK